MKAVRMFLILCCVCYQAHAQEMDSISWEEMQSVPATKSASWTIDRFGNHYLCQDGVMLKYDSLSHLTFKQSIKKLGNIKHIMAVNAMKIWVFSEEQQRLCAFDNTLTPVESCLNLSDLGFEYVAQVCPSSQPDRVWILDQVNSRLVQYHLSQHKNAIEISNLIGILAIDEVIKIEESGNNLFISDKNGLIFRLDTYGTLIDAFELGPFIDFTVENNRLLVLYTDHLMAMMLDNGEKHNLNLPVPFPTGLELSSMNLFLKTENKILKYRALSTP